MPNKNPIYLMNQNQYTTKYDDEIRSIIKMMKTEAYFLERGGNSPNWKEGGETIKKWADVLWNLTKHYRPHCDLWREYKDTEDYLLSRAIEREANKRFSKYNHLKKEELKTLCRSRNVKLSRKGVNNSYCLRINLIENDIGRCPSFDEESYIAFTRSK